MSFEGSKTDVDLRPWAAFVSGHHPFDLLNRHLILDTMARDLDLEILPERGPWDRIPRLRDELDRSLRILAKLPSIDPARLRAFQYSLNKINHFDFDLNNAIKYDGYESVLFGPDGFFDGARPHGEELASALPFIRVGDELRSWQELGVAVGKYKLNPGQSVTGFPTPESTRKLARELVNSTKYPAPERLVDFVEELEAGDSIEDSVWPLMPIRKRPLYRVSRYLSCILRKRARPERWIELDEHRLTFFGERFYIDTLPEGESESDYQGRIPKAEAAFLWVLAKQPGVAVPRETIKTEGELERDENSLQFYRSNLRLILGPVIEDYFKKRGLPLPKYADKCFMVGMRGRNAISGPYLLSLDPDRVWVSPEKPSWMLPRTTPQS